MTTTYANETNGLIPGEAHPCEALQGEVALNDPSLAKITRLRMLTERGFPFLDVSYCYGELKNGTPVRVNLPVRQFPRKNVKAAIIAMCREENVYGKGIGILDESNWSILY